jgi:hypothetical protein
MVPSPILIQDSICIYFSVENPLPASYIFFSGGPGEKIYLGIIIPDRFSYLLKRAINVCVTRAAGKKNPLLVRELQCPVDCEELCVWQGGKKDRSSPTL